MDIDRETMAGALLRELRMVARLGRTMDAERVQDLLRLADDDPALLERVEQDASRCTPQGASRLAMQVAGIVDAYLDGYDPWDMEPPALPARCAPALAAFLYARAGMPGQAAYYARIALALDLDADLARRALDQIVPVA